MGTQLVTPPTNDASRTYEQLGYVDAYDAPLNCDYAFVAFKETERDSGAWRVRIKSSQTTGVVFEPDMIRSQARAAGAQGKPYFTWGAGIEPGTGDPRQIEYRVHQAAGAPSAVEVVVRMRKFDHTPDEGRAMKFNWPG